MNILFDQVLMHSDKEQREQMFEKLTQYVTQMYG